MATLNSPGVSVSVIDESFYTPAAPGTVPLIIVASAQDKMNASGTGIAAGTQKANAGTVYLITSQRDLTDTFGTPLFYTDASGNPVNGGELNEYGLQAAYSLLGVSSAAYVARADLDLSELVPQSSAPVGLPADGTYWLDTTSNTSWGIFEWNETTQAFVNKVPTIIDNSNMDMYLSEDGMTPASNFLTPGSYVVVATSTNEIQTWYKNSSSNWVQIGTNTETGFTAGSTFSSTVWQTSWPVVTSSIAIPASLSSPPGPAIIINGQTVTLPGPTLTPSTLATSINAIMRNQGVNATIGTGGVLQLFADATASSNGASGASAQATMEVATIAIANSGTHYAVGNILNVMGGAGTSATIQVTAITTSGAITSATIVNSGEYTGSIPNAGGAITTANTTGPTGATFNLTFTVEAINIVSGGVDYDVPPTVGIGGNATIGTVTVSGGAVTNIAVSNPGSGYTSIPSVSIQNPNVQDGKIKIQAANTGTSTTFLAAIGLTAGTYNPVTLFQGPHTAYPDFSSTPSGSVYIKTTNPNQGAFWATKIYSASTNAWNLVKAPIYAKPELAIAGLDPAKDGANIAVGTLYVKDNYDDGIGLASEPSLAEFQIFRRTSTGPTTIVSPTKIQTVTFTNTSTFDIKESYQGAFINTATITIQPGDTLSTVVGYINAAGLQYTSATYDNTQFTVTITHSLGGEIRFLDGTHTPLATALGFTAWSRNPTTGVTAGTTNFYGVGMYEPDGYTYEASNWAPLVFEAQPTAPYLDPEDGTLWFDSLVDEVDIMYHNGINWVGYRDSSAFPGTDPNGPQIASEAPTTQSDGTSLVNGDIWISTADLTMYGQNIYVWNGQTLKWVQQDPTDHTTPNGWLFADARWATSGTTETASTIKALLTSNYVDPDSPDPSLYTKGTRLWNLRRSGYNVKKYEANYINLEANGGLNLRYQNQVMDGSGGATPYVTARWVSVSPNTPLGVGSFGQAAQRSFVVKSLKSLIDTSQAIRDTDTLVFNLIACPGYIETLQNLIGLNTDRGQTAFVVGDTPMTLEPTGTALSNWGNNSALAYDNGPDGIVSFDDYAAVYYPSGYTTDNTGNYIVVPPSHMMLRTIAESDQKSYPWFAPAGVRRGAVDNVSSVGYIDDIGEFHPTALPESLRDVLANVKVNPIATLTGSGIITMGQYTRANAASSLDRINVARLVAYIRRQLGILAKPYLFEPNDKITRDEIKGAVSSFFLQLVGQRAIYDFLVVCDESNNTPTRIDQNQLWVDIAIEPVKAVEFIYIPLRLENTGAISAGG